MLKTRSRIVNFRVTEDEFTRLSAASLENGASCLSNYVRTVMLQAVEDHYYHDLGAGNGKEELQVLTQRLWLVERSIAKLESMVSRLSTDEPAHIRVGVSV